MVGHVQQTGVILSCKKIGWEVYHCAYKQLVPSHTLQQCKQNNSQQTVFEP